MNSESTALKKRENNGQSLQHVNQPMSIDDLAYQVETIQQAMGRVMHENEHFGTIPGTNKPTLLKAGAEKLTLLFQLAPKYDINRNDLENGHREYEIITKLYNKNTGNFVGEGVGICSTKESKYRYRKGKLVCPECRKEGTIIKGKKEYGGGWICYSKKGGCSAKWDDGAKAIEDQDIGKVENPDIADVYNTVLKMAKKRSQVDATLTATAASDIFTQDLEEDLGGNMTGQSEKKSSQGKNRSKEEVKGLSDEDVAKVQKFLTVLPDDHPKHDIDLKQISQAKLSDLIEFCKFYKDVRSGLSQMKKVGNLSSDMFDDLVEKLRVANRMLDLEIIVDDMETINSIDGVPMDGKEQAELLYSDDMTKEERSKIKDGLGFLSRDRMDEISSRMGSSDDPISHGEAKEILKEIDQAKQMLDEEEKSNRARAGRVQ